MLGHDPIDVGASRDRSDGPMHPFCFGVQLFREKVKYVENLLLPVFTEAKAQTEKAQQKQKREDDRPSGLAIPMVASPVPLGHQRQTDFHTC